MHTDLTINLTTERSLRSLIHAADQLLTASRRDVLAAEGLRRGELRLLRRIESGEWAPRSPHGSRRIGHLVHTGLVARGSRGWMLTARGTETLERSRAALGSIDQQIVDAISPEQADAMTAALNDVVATLGGADALREIRHEQRARRRMRRARMARMLHAAPGEACGHRHGSGHRAFHRGAHRAGGFSVREAHESR